MSTVTSLAYIKASLVFCIAAGMSLTSCKRPSGGNVADSDSLQVAEEQLRLANTPLPVKPLPSASDVTYEVEIADSAVSGQLSELVSRYDIDKGSFTFRGGPLRDACFNGKVKGTPKEIVELWSFETDEDYRPTPVGTWGGGTGWTGQPIYVNWPDSIVEAFKKYSPALTPDFSNKEIMIGTLAHKIYFINFDNGKSTRQPLETTNPVKGSMCLDPSLNGNLYVGQAAPITRPFGQMAFNLFTHKQTYFSGQDRKAWVGWGGNDSSPLSIGGFLFFPAENGSLYKYKVNERGITLHSTLRYKTQKHGAAGHENSMVAYRNYGFVGNNRGDIICFDLNTLRIIWHYDNADDIDASMVCEVVDGVPYLYCGCEVDQQGDVGKSHFVKLNGLTGEPVWEQIIPCRKLTIQQKHFDGGFYSTPLLGTGNCSDMIFANVCQRENSSKAEFTAFSKETGEAVYRVQLDNFAWSSPVGFLNEQNQMFIFAGDASGNAYLIEGKTGNVLYKNRLVRNFESSPVVVGNQLVVGSRGKTIHKFEIR